MTAEEFFNKYGGYTRKEMLLRSREFAKYHVEKALKTPSEEAVYNGYNLASIEIDKYSILNAYPLENIK